MDHDFKLMLFSIDAGAIAEATAAGIDGIVVDWENSGKRRRQALVDTQINSDTIADLERVRQATAAAAAVICRVNQFGEHTSGEVEAAIRAGADEILLPMAGDPAEVEAVIQMAAGRIAVGMLVETEAAVQRVAQLGRLQLSRVYVGLNDLAIDRGTANIFTALVDGTVDSIRASFDMPFGLAGLTLPELGQPIPCRLLLAELARLDCGFTFLRRSFLRDIQGRHMSFEVPRIRQAMAQARLRDEATVERERQELREAVAAWQPSAIAGSKR